jgi:hypothetical protein
MFLRLICKMGHKDFYWIILLCTLTFCVYKNRTIDIIKIKGVYEARSH